MGRDECRAQRRTAFARHDVRIVFDANAQLAKRRDARRPARIRRRSSRAAASGGERSGRAARRPHRATARRSLRRRTRSARRRPRSFDGCRRSATSRSTPSSNVDTCAGLEFSYSTGSNATPSQRLDLTRFDLQEAHEHVDVRVAARTPAESRSAPRPARPFPQPRTLPARPRRTASGSGFCAPRRCTDRECSPRIAPHWQRRAPARSRFIVAPSRGRTSRCSAASQVGRPVAIL